MSDYGAIFRNNNSQIQIDSTYDNYTLWDKRTDEWTANITNFDITESGNIGSSENIIVVHRVGTDAYSGILGPFLGLAGGYWARAQFWYALGPVGEPSDLVWAIFRDGPTNSPPSSGYGMIVNNSAGDTVFHSDDEYFNITGVYNSSLAMSGDGSGNYIDITVEDAVNNYFLISPVAMYIYIGGAPYYYRPWIARTIIYLNPTTVRVQESFIQNYGYPLYSGVSEWVNAFTLTEVKIL